MNQVNTIRYYYSFLVLLLILGCEQTEEPQNIGCNQAVPRTSISITYKGQHETEVRKLLLNVGNWTTNSSLSVSDGAPPQVQINPDCLRDAYVKAAVLLAWAAESYYRLCEFNKATDAALAMRANLTSADNLCGGITYDAQVEPCKTLSIWVCNLAPPPNNQVSSIIIANKTPSLVAVTANGETKTLLPGGTATYSGQTGKELSFKAETVTKTSSGAQIGSKIEWNRVYIFTATSQTFNLEIDPSYFYLSVENKSSTTFNPLQVNPETSFQINDNILITPSDGVSKGVGYYRALTNTEIRFFREGTSQYLFYKAGEHFTFSNTINQTIKVIIPATLPGPAQGEIVFTNKAFTPITIDGNGQTKVVNPEAQVVFAGEVGKELKMVASTSGKSAQGSQIGLKVEWSGAYSFTQSKQNINLNLSQDYFYLYLANSTSDTFTPLYVNFGLQSEVKDQILISTTNGDYRGVGYYRAFSNSNVRAYKQGTSAFAFWNQGQHFNLPGGVNQSIKLRIN